MKRTHAAKQSDFVHRSGILHSRRLVLVRKHPEFKAGDTITVSYKIKEGDKERTQIFEGLVIARKHGKGINASFTVRKVASGVGVEKVYPLHTPFIEKIEVVKSSKVRRAKLYFIREAKGKRSKLKGIRKEMKVTTLDDATPVAEDAASE